MNLFTTINKSILDEALQTVAGCALLLSCCFLQKEKLVDEWNNNTAAPITCNKVVLEKKREKKKVVRLRLHAFSKGDSVWFNSTPDTLLVCQ